MFDTVIHVYVVTALSSLGWRCKIGYFSALQLRQYNYRERRVERLLIPECPEHQLFVQHRDRRQRQSVVQG